MGRNHDRLRADMVYLLLELNSTGAQFLKHTVVVDQAAQNRDRLSGAFVVGKTNCVADAEAHTEMSCANDLHKTTTGRGWRKTTNPFRYYFALQSKISQLLILFKFFFTFPFAGSAARFSPANQCKPKKPFAL